MKTRLFTLGKLRSWHLWAEKSIQLGDFCSMTPLIAIAVAVGYVARVARPAAPASRMPPVLALAPLPQRPPTAVATTTYTWGEPSAAAARTARSPWSAWAGLSASYGWCLNEAELQEMQRVQDTLVRETAYLGREEEPRLRLAVEIAYQSRAWSTEQRSAKRLAHAVAVARVLAEQQMEAEAVLAALLAGVCEDTGLTYVQLDEILGSAVAAAVRDVAQVWELSNLLQDAPAHDSEQLEHRCQIVLAGCDDWRGVVLSLASRLVSARELQVH